MSERYADRDAIRAKIEWEGGIVEAIDYGIKSTDMPVGDDELIAAWGALETAYKALAPLADAVEALLEPEDDDAGEFEDTEPAYSDPPRADLSGHDPHQFPTVAELGGERFADYPGLGL